MLHQATSAAPMGGFVHPGIPHGIQYIPTTTKAPGDPTGYYLIPIPAHHHQGAQMGENPVYVPPHFSFFNPYSPYIVHHQRATDGSIAVPSTRFAYGNIYGRSTSIGGEAQKEQTGN
jgi:hypothetical protein